MSNIGFTKDAGVARIVLARSEKSNAVDMSMAIRACLADDVRAVTVTAEGRMFCVGGDVMVFGAADDASAYVLELATGLEEGLRALADVPSPVIAGVRGAVARAGLAVMLTCDVIVASRATKFVMAYPGIGLTPECGVSYLLPRAIGQQRALDLALTGRALDAEEACAWGLVTEVVDDDEVELRVADVARAWADSAPAALGQARRLVRQSWDTPREQQGADGSRTIAAAIAEDEAVRLVKSFVSR